jgi:hypothetical protein
LFAATVAAWTNAGTPLFNSGGQPVTLAADTTGEVRWLTTDSLGRLILAGPINVQPSGLVPVIDTLTTSASPDVDTLVFDETASIVMFQNTHDANELYFSFDASVWATVLPERSFAISGVGLDTMYFNSDVAGISLEVVSQH